MRRGMMAGALGLLAGALGFAQTPTLTLDQAVDAALNGGADRIVVEANGVANQALYAKTAAAAGPQVTLTGGVSDTGTTASADGVQTASVGTTLALGSTSLTVKGSQTTDDTRTVSVTLAQNLWDGYLGGQTGGTARQADLNRQSAALTAQADLRALVQSVKEAYYTLLSAQENQTGLASTLTQAEKSLALIQARYDAKQASPIDLQTAKINARTAEVNSREGLATLKKAQRTLAHLMGRTDLTEFRVAAAEEPLPAPATVEEALAYAQAHRYERQTTDLTLQAARVGLDLARAAGQPTVDLSAAAGQSASSGTTAANFSLGLDLSWSAWDSGATAQSVLRQEALVRAAEAARTQQQLTIQREVEAAWEDWGLKTDKADLAKLSAEKAQASLAVARAQYEAGTITNTALLEAESDAMDALSTQAAATINLRLAVLTLKTALGYEE